MLLDVAVMAEELLSFLYDSLDCTLFGRPKDAKIALCEPQDVCCDYLAVYIDQLPGMALVSSCEQLSDEFNVEFRVKLVRPVALQNQCTPTKQDLDKVRSSIVDGVALRQAMLRFATEHAANILGCDPCFVEFEIMPLVSTCADDKEQCSGWLTGISLSMNLCDDGPCASPLSEVSGRFCVDDPLLVLDSPNGDAVLSYE